MVVPDQVLCLQCLDVRAHHGMPADPLRNSPSPCICQILSLGFWNVLRRPHPPFVLSKHVNQINTDTLQFYRLIPYTLSPTFLFPSFHLHQVIRHFDLLFPPSHLPSTMSSTPRIVSSAATRRLLLQCTLARYDGWALCTDSSQRIPDSHVLLF